MLLSVAVLFLKFRPREWGVIPGAISSLGLGEQAMLGPPFLGLFSWLIDVHTHTWLGESDGMGIPRWP